jgi:hypothetical protein
MLSYRVHFKTHGGYVFGVQHFQCAGEEDAIKTVYAMDVPSIGYGFELWHEERLVHVHPPLGPKQ